VGSVIFDAHRWIIPMQTVENGFLLSQPQERAESKYEPTSAALSNAGESKNILLMETWGSKKC